MLSEVLIIAISLLLWFWYRHYSPPRPHNFPNGPISFPFTGSLPLLGKDAVAMFQQWKVKYGPIVGFNFSTFRTVMINDSQWIKEAFEQEVFSGRPALPPLIFLSGWKKRGITQSEGPTFHEQRRFSLRNLRDFGFGKKSMERMIHEDVESVLAQLKSSRGQPIVTAEMFSIAVLSSLWRIVAGEKPIHDQQLHEELELKLRGLRGFTQAIQFGSPITLFYSWLTKIIPERFSQFSPVAKSIVPIKRMLKVFIDEHRRTYDPNSMRDLIDIYLREIYQTKDPSSSFYEDEGHENLLIVILNLFGAGSETTSNSINWAILLLSLNPAVLVKIQKELDEVVGRDRLPGLEDKPRCVYTEAVMQEVFRYSSILPVGIFHNTMSTVQFHGFTLPKDTMVMANLYGVHHDEQIWGDPESFRPERFLSPDGKTLLKDKPLFAFSTGKRACLGEPLARNEFFLFLSAICQKFNFVPNPLKAKPDPKVTIPTSLFRFPKQFELCFSDRQESS